MEVLVNDLLKQTTSDSSEVALSDIKLYYILIPYSTTSKQVHYQAMIIIPTFHFHIYLLSIRQNSERVIMLLVWIVWSTLVAAQASCELTVELRIPLLQHCRSAFGKTNGLTCLAHPHQTSRLSPGGHSSNVTAHSGGWISWFIIC